MATNHTTNYQLNLWEASDKFVREEFNENTSKIDTAIKAVDAKADTKADAAALNALSQTVAKKADTAALSAFGNCRVETGTYVGNGVYGETEANATVLHLGYRPRVLFISSESNGSMFLAVWPGKGPLGLCYGYGVALEAVWMEDGLKWWLAHSGNNAVSQFNAEGVTYHYIAFR